MEINTKAKYELQAGDILSWISGTEEILFMVTNNTSDEIVGITLRDNRTYNDGKSHVVMFPYQADHWKLTLMLKNEGQNIKDYLHDVLEAWDSE